MLIVGGDTWFWTASTVKTDSMPPAPPSRWPVIDLVELTTMPCARSPSASLIASVSFLSPSGVDVRARVAQCREHAAAWPVGAGRGDVVGIRAHAEARELRVDPGAAALRVLVLLEHHHARALAEHEAVPVDVPGSARGLRIVVA